jgi:hypothetical protein
MKKLKELKGINNIFVDAINELDGKLQNQLKNIKQEYQTNVIDEKLKLLLDICNGENLDFVKMKNKYIKSKELNKVLQDETTETKKIEEENMLDKIEFNGKQYYYESKENGMIYDMESNLVGIYKNGSIILN